MSPGLCSKGNLQWGAPRRVPREQRPRANSDYSRRNIWPEEISEPQAAAHLGSNNVPYWWPPFHCEQLAWRVHTVQKGRDFLLQILGCFPGVMGWCWSNNFYQAVESKSSVRNCSKLPPSLGPPPSSGLDEIGGWGAIPTLESLGLSVTKAGLVEASCASGRNFTSSNFLILFSTVSSSLQSEKGMHFKGGENAALGRIHEYFWKTDQLKVYKETRNGMLGPDYSTKFSPWLASGSLSPRYICEEVKNSWLTAEIVSFA